MRGAWIEIFDSGYLIPFLVGRSPCGERGLKSVMLILLEMVIMSLPMRGAWIEMKRIG